MLSNLAILGNLNTTFCLSQRNADCHILVIPYFSIFFHQNVLEDSLFAKSRSMKDTSRFRSEFFFFSGAANLFTSNKKDKIKTEDHGSH